MQSKVTFTLVVLLMIEVYGVTSPATLINSVCIYIDCLLVFPTCHTKNILVN